LHLCAFFGLRATIEHEFENGAEVDPKDAEGKTPLTWAAHNGYDEVVSLLMTRSDIKISGIVLNTDTDISEEDRAWFVAMLDHFTYR
jgi:ankyrin repeat protein